MVAISWSGVGAEGMLPVGVGLSEVTGEGAALVGMAWAIAAAGSGREDGAGGGLFVVAVAIAGMAGLGRLEWVMI